MKKARSPISDAKLRIHANTANLYHSHANSHHSYRSCGFSLVEVLLAVSVFSLIVTALVGGLIYGQQSTAFSGARARAAILADEGLEAIRNIRDENFSNLTDSTPTYGLAVSDNKWTLSGTSDTTDIFTRAITISTVDSNRKQVIATVSWQQNPQRTGVVSAITYLTNWKASVPISSCSIYCQSLESYSSGTCRRNPPECTQNGEINEPGGNRYCTDDPLEHTCCCAP